MITLEEVEKLRGIRSDEPVIFSLYLSVPLEPAGLRNLPALARELVEAAAARASRQAGPDRDAIAALVAARGRDWLGHTAAIFACGRLGLLEVVLLPGGHDGRAVLGRAPYVRPLLAAVQRNPAYLIAVADRRHAWLLSAAAGQAETIMRTEAPPAGPPRFGGWQGRDAYRVQQRMIQHDRHHYGEMAEILARQVTGDPRRPVVAGGPAESVGHLVRAMPPRVRAAFAGSFAADLHTLTPARAQELAGPVIDRWSARREEAITAAVFGVAPAEHRAAGLAACLAAASAGAVSLLLLRDGAQVPGFACRRCGALTTDPAGCPDRGTGAQPVPDLLELLAGRVLDDGGQVLAVRSAPADVAARLRYPARGTNGPEPATNGSVPARAG
jgi:hypothetical protein